MIKRISLLILILCSLQVSAQKNLTDGRIVLENNDTISGQLKNKKYYSASGVKLYNGKGKNRYSINILSDIFVDTVHYVKSDCGLWSKAFFKKEISGGLNLYTYKRKILLGGYDSDINKGRLTPSLEFYCSDYPGFEDTLCFIDEDNIYHFVNNYNRWNTTNPQSKSYYESHIHYKPGVNFKLSFLLPGAGFEFGITESLSICTILKTELSWGGYVGFAFNPILDSQLRYYHNINKRKINKQRTYKYSGNYVCLTNMYSRKYNLSLIGFEYGWQRIWNKHWYYNLGFGLGKMLNGNQGISILIDYDFGYNF